MHKELRADVNFYELLGIDRKAGKSEVKKAYRELAKKYHPDVNHDPKAENIFQNIKSAYDILSDPNKRRIYDYLLFRQEQRNREGYTHYKTNRPSYTHQRRSQKAYHQKREREETFTKNDYIQFNLKQVISLGILIIVFSAGVLLTGFGLRFMFLKDFNGSMVAGYFTTAAGLGLIYGTVKGIKVLITLWQYGIANYNGDHGVAS